MKGDNQYWWWLHWFIISFHLVLKASELVGKQCLFAIWPAELNSLCMMLNLLMYKTLETLYTWGVCCCHGHLSACLSWSCWWEGIAAVLSVSWQRWLHWIWHNCFDIQAAHQWYYQVRSAFFHCVNFVSERWFMLATALNYTACYWL